MTSVPVFVVDESKTEFGISGQSKGHSVREISCQSEGSEAGECCI